LLWRSPAWTGATFDPAREHALLGTRWQEFIHPADLPALLTWFANGTRGEHHFRAMAPRTGQYVRLFYYKTEWQSHWIVIGHAIPIADDFPAPPFGLLTAALSTAALSTAALSSFPPV
ncbi:MAG: hypothetical protein RLZZ15_596, partial [Verrucomicrobiota bacterium]